MGFRDLIVLIFKYLILMSFLVSLVAVSRYYFVDILKFTTFSSIFDIMNGLSVLVAAGYFLKHYDKAKLKYGNKKVDAE